MAASSSKLARSLSFIAAATKSFSSNSPLPLARAAQVFGATTPVSPIPPPPPPPTTLLPSRNTDLASAKNVFSAAASNPTSGAMPAGLQRMQFHSSVPRSSTASSSPVSASASSFHSVLHRLVFLRYLTNSLHSHTIDINIASLPPPIYCCMFIPLYFLLFFGLLNFLGYLEV